MSACLVEYVADDVEIYDYFENFKTYSLQIKNKAGYTCWSEQVQILQNCQCQQKFEFGVQQNQINIHQNEKPQKAELIIYNDKICMRNKDSEQISYQLMELQQVLIDNIVRIGKYIVKFDKKSNIVYFQDESKLVYSIQLTEIRQNLIINGINLGIVHQQFDGSILYQANKMNVFGVIKQNEELEIKDSQNFQFGITYFSVEYRLN